MSWRIVKRINITSNDPLIIINNKRFSYNMPFVRIAEIEKYGYVTYYIDEDNRKIGFEFNSTETEHSSKVIGNSKQGYISCSVELFKTPWLQKTAKMKSQNKYKPTKDGKKWIITLRPVFENSIKREDSPKILSDIKGIYRYIDEKRIVYIGKGSIKDRLKEDQREEWKFDTIEYSLIDNDDECLVLI
jgi:hypothetical protein